MKLQKRKWNGILYNGEYNNYVIDTGLTNKGNLRLEMRKRLSTAYLLATTPETFDILSQNNVNLFHGTKIDALPNILNYGMNSFDELSKKGVEVSTGEQCTRNFRGRSFISFTDDLDTALGYSAMNSLTENSQQDNSFGMIIGMSTNAINNLRTCNVFSDTPEIGILNNVPLEYIKVIAVPEEKVKFVRKLVKDRPITVVPIDMNNKFFYIDDVIFDIYYEKANEFTQKSKEKPDDFIQNTKEEPEKFIFDKEDVKELTSERKFSGIKKIFEKIKKSIQSIRGKINERNLKNSGNDSR